MLNKETILCGASANGIELDENYFNIAKERIEDAGKDEQLSYIQQNN